MYDELIKRLRNAAQWADKGFVITPSVCIEAADAIEELSKPRWIPVTERLPECEWGAEVGNIEWISCGMVFAGCFGRGGKYRDAYFRTWTNGTEGIDAKDAGDMPTKQYSDILARIYNEPQFYSELLESNKGNLKSALAYEKSHRAVTALLSADIPSDSKINTVIQYLLSQCEDVTPLS